MKRLAFIILLMFIAVPIVGCDNYFIGCGFSRAKCN